jgi:hypothetical protein
MISLALIGCLILGIAAISPAMANDSQTNSTDNFKHKRFEHFRNCGIYCQLDKQLEDGTITQEQYDGMKAVQETVNNLRNEIQETWSNGLRNHNIINQEQYDEMLKKQAERTKLLESLKELTPEERQVKMAELKETKLKELLENNTITQEQYDQFMKNNGPGFGEKPQERRQSMRNHFGYRW